MVYNNDMGLILLVYTCLHNCISNALEIKYDIRTVLKHLYDILLVDCVWIILENS